MSGDSGSSPGGRFPRHRLALALAASWIAVLTALAALTANPVTLNVLQVLRASSDGGVVSATVMNAAEERCRVDEVLAGGQRSAVAGLKPGDEIRVRELQRIGAAEGRAYVFPLQRGRNESFLVMPTELPNRQPLIYPDGPAARQQLKTILRAVSDEAPAAPVR
ncbi:MAG: hypothetical protein KF774_17225 [Planctomyces sp.]|nr:hypothetical protein [Planctomyces sp.]